MSGIKAIVAGHEKTITQVPMLVNGVDKGWEVRTGDGELLWGAKRTITGTTPMTLKGYGIPLDACNIIGNGQQSGTPTPDNPVMPTFCGVRTANLFDMSDFSLLQVTSTAYRYGTNVGVLPQGTYTFNATKSTGAQSIYLTAKLNGIYSQTTISSVPFTFSADGESEYIIRTANNTGTTWEAEKYLDMMLNLGSTALPYEPFGWAEKITCAGQTTPVYLWQTQTVRRIKKLVLTGSETKWSNVSGNAPYRIMLEDIVSTRDRGSVLFLSSHYLAVSNNASWAQYNACVSWAFSGDNINVKCLQFRDTNQATLADFKSYLAAQYAAGTPVCVWYVLATPTTGIVNEPLCKIGDYADELHSADAAVTIPTAKGQNTLTVETDLQPSQISVTGHIKSIS